MTHEELAKASDAAVINLLDSLADRHARGGDHSDMRFDVSRSGGIVEEARELGVLAKSDPCSGAPNRGPTRRGTARIGCREKCLADWRNPRFPRPDSSSSLSSLMTGGAGRTISARALQTPWQPALLRSSPSTSGSCGALGVPGLRRRLSRLSERDTEDSPHDHERDSSILFTLGGLVMLMQGRGSMIRALAAGLQRARTNLVRSMFRILAERLATKTIRRYGPDSVRLPSAVRG